MNVFLVGCNLSGDIAQRAPEIFKSTAAQIPNLNVKTYWQVHRGAVFAASMGHRRKAAAPRFYLHNNARQAVIFDGSIYDPVSDCIVDQAEWLADHWSDCPGRLEGQFAAVNVGYRPEAVQVFVDHIGHYRVYHCRCDGGHLISNSIGLLTRLRGKFSLDVEAMAMLAAHGRAMGGATLQRGVTALDGGSIWSWSIGESSPCCRRYFDRTAWSRIPKRIKSPAKIRDLSDTMVRPLRHMVRRYGPVKAPLTAGRDSRVLFAMLTANGVSSRFFSVGDPSLADVRVGSHIARHYRVDYQLRTLDDGSLLESWDRLVRQLMATTDGTVSVVHAANIFDRPPVDHLEVMLYGAYGEFARNMHIDSAYQWNRLTLSGLQRHLIGAYEKNNRAMPRRAAIETSRKIVGGQIRSLSQEGFAVDDILLAHYMFNRAPHFAGAMARLLEPHTEVYCPYCTPAFAAAAFSEPMQERMCDRLHYRMISGLLPELHRLPIQYPWYIRHPLKLLLNTLRMDIKNYLLDRLNSRSGLPAVHAEGNRSIRHLRAQWLMALIERYRSFCLDRQQSEIWDVIDREAFEQATRNNHGPNAFWASQDEIFDVITLFVYAAQGAEKGGEAIPVRHSLLE
jgi:asparagine synthetase B (glutamine-hydrolysing)